MNKYVCKCLSIALLNVGVFAIILKADNIDTEQNVDAISEQQAGHLIENQPVKLSEDGRSLLVPQISQLDMEGKIRNHAAYDQQGNRYLQLMDGNPSIKLDSNKYIKLFDGSMVNAESLACPVHFYNDIVIFRDYRMGLAFPAGWKIIVQTSDKIVIIDGPFTLTSKQTDSNRVGNELDTGMLIKNIGAFRIGSKWDKLFANLRKAGLVLSRTNTDTNFSWCEFKLDPPSPLLKAYFDALYANANLQVTANAEGNCYKDLLFGDSPSQVQAKMAQYKDLSPLVPKALTQYGLQYNDNDLAYAGYFAGLPVIVRCMFMPEGASNFSLTAVSFTHLVGGYNTDATAVTTAFGLQDAETKAKWQTLLGNSQGAFNTSMTALSDFLKASQEIQQQRLQSRDVAVKFEQAITAAGYVGTKKAPDGSVTYMNPRRINANLAYNDNLVNLQLTNLRGLYQATLDEHLDAFDKANKALNDEMTSNAESINNTVNDLNGVPTPTSSPATPAANTAPTSFPSTPDTAPPAETPQAGQGVSSPLASKIVGSWQGPRHIETYLADGRYGLDVDTTGEYYGQWSISGNTLKTTWAGVNTVTVCTNVIITDSDFSFDSNGQRFTYHRVNDQPVPGH